MNKDNKILAIVVTYNRKELLLENIRALLGQSYDNFNILIIDNASNDGTQESIKQFESSKIKYLRLEKNVGGAGGFSVGIKEATQQGYEYAWIMDDDTIPTKEALKSFVKKVKFLKNEFSFLCSVVKFNENEICNMNIPTIHKKWIMEYPKIHKNLIKVESCSFVSCFINLKFVFEIGLPIEEFFIYGDDIEYTLRLSNKTSAYIDIDSIVLHKMKSNANTDVITADKEKIGRVFYTYRNRFYLAKKKGTKQVIKYITGYSINIVKILIKSKDNRLKRMYYMTKGFFVGIFFNPDIKRIK